MRRGDVWWARLPQPTGLRPVVLMTRDDALHVRTRVTVIPLSTKVRDIETEVRLGPSDGLPRAGVANADELVTIPKSCLERRIAALKSEKISALDDAVRFALALDR